MKLGEGSIGTDTFIRIINHPKLVHYLFWKHLMIEGYAKEIDLLREF